MIYMVFINVSIDGARVNWLCEKGTYFLVGLCFLHKNCFN